MLKPMKLSQVFLLGLSLVFALGARAALVPAPPQLAAKSYLLMDYHSGKVIAEGNADMPVEPASLTKMMTSYVVSAEIAKGNISLDDKVTISKNAWAKNFAGGSVMFIEVGTQVTVEDLLRGLIVQSGNDAAVALAEHVAGSEAVFADLMNQYAKQLGLKNTHFVNSNGLPAEGHVTTARDLAILARAMIRDYPQEYAIYKEKWFTYNGIKQPNRNTLLWDTSLEVDGIKTGHTEAAGYCLVASATRDEMRLISVVMGAKSKDARAAESKKLLAYGFRFFDTVRALEAGKILHTQRIWMGDKETINLGIPEDIYVTIPRGQGSKLKARYVVARDIKAPIAKGQMAGKVSFTLNGEKVAEYPLVAMETVNEAGFFGRMADSVAQWFDELMQ